MAGDRQQGGTGTLSFIRFSIFRIFVSEAAINTQQNSVTYLIFFFLFSCGAMFFFKVSVFFKL